MVIFLATINQCSKSNKIFGNLFVVDFLKPAWSNCFWPTGHFAKMWEIGGTSNKTMHKTIDSQDLKLKKGISVGFLWSRFLWHCSYINTNVSHGWLNHFESEGEQAHVKKLWKKLWFELKTVTSQALKITSLNFVSLSVCLSNFMQRFVSPQLPLSPRHLHYSDLST